VNTRPDLSERWSDRLQVGQMAPDFTLPVLTTGDDRQTVSLKKLRAKKPVVLIFGSVTCPPFRGQLNGVEQVYREFRDRAEFLWVYIREAHPDSVLSLRDASGQEKLTPVPQHTEFSSRSSVAAACQRTWELQMPIAVDGIDNSAGQAYAGWPNRMVVVGTDGRIAFASPGAPGGTNAEQLRAWLGPNLPAGKSH
jgi:hypothetical protein